MIYASSIKANFLKDLVCLNIATSLRQAFNTVLASFCQLGNS